MTTYGHSWFKTSLHLLCAICSVCFRFVLHSQLSSSPKFPNSLFTGSLIGLVVHSTHRFLMCLLMTYRHTKPWHKHTEQFNGLNYSCYPCLKSSLYFVYHLTLNPIFCVLTPTLLHHSGSTICDPLTVPVLALTKAYHSLFFTDSDRSGGPKKAVAVPFISQFFSVYYELIKLDSFLLKVVGCFNTLSRHLFSV